MHLYEHTHAPAVLKCIFPWRNVIFPHAASPFLSCFLNIFFSKNSPFWAAHFDTTPTPVQKRHALGPFSNFFHQRMRGLSYRLAFFILFFVVFFDSHFFVVFGLVFYFLLLGSPLCFFFSRCVCETKLSQTCAANLPPPSHPSRRQCRRPYHASYA